MRDAKYARAIKSEPRKSDLINSFLLNYDFLSFLAFSYFNFVLFEMFIIFKKIYFIYIVINF